jgi:hypothetical protein
MDANYKHAIHNLYLINELYSDSWINTPVDRKSKWVAITYPQVPYHLAQNLVNIFTMDDFKKLLEKIE